MKTKLKTRVLFFTILQLSISNCLSQTLSAEYEDKVYETSNSLGINFQVLPVDETKFVHITHRAFAGGRLSITFEFVDLENQSSSSLEHFVKGYYSGNAYIESGKLIMSYGKNTWSPKNLLILDIETSEFFQIELQDIHKDFKKFCIVRQFRITDDKIYFIGSLEPSRKTTWISGIYDFSSDQLDHILHSNSVRYLGLFHLDNKLILTKTESATNGGFKSTIGYLKDDFTVENESTLVTGSDALLTNTHITKHPDGTFFITGSTFPIGGTRNQSKLFWSNWNSDKVFGFGSVSIPEIELASTFYDEKRKNVVRKKINKTYINKWTVKFQQTCSKGGDIVLFQNQSSDFILIKTNADSKLIWSDAGVTRFYETSPFKQNINDARQFVSVDEQNDVLSIDYVDNPQIKSINFSLEDGAKSETIESGNLMELSVEGSKTVDLNFVICIGEEEYVIFQVFEAGSKLNTSSIKYKRMLFVRHVLIQH